MNGGWPTFAQPKTEAALSVSVFNGWELRTPAPPGIRKQKPRDSLGACVILDDACQLNRTSPDWYVNEDFKIRVTSEGEGIEP
jgi:hypothetical protein